MTTGKVLLGVLAGIAAGATLGILFAPDKGTATRKKITQKGDDYVEDMEAKFNEFVDTITHKFNAVRDEAMKMADKGKSKLEEVEAEAMTANGKVR